MAMSLVCVLRRPLAIHRNSPSAAFKCLCRYYLSQHEKSESIGDLFEQLEVPEQPLKTFAQIQSEIRERSEGRRLSKVAACRQFPQIHYSELHKNIGLGDLLLIKSGPVVVVKVPNGFGLPLLVADAVGVVHEIFLQSVDARLFNLIPMTALQDVQVTRENGTVLTLEVFTMVSREIRRYASEATTLSTAIVRHVSDTILLLRRNDESVVISYVDFCKTVLKKYRGSRLTADSSRTQSFARALISDKPILPVELIYAVRLALDHYQLAGKVVLDFNYLSSYTLTILPADVERRHAEVEASNFQIDSSAKHDVGKDARNYLKDYALHGLSTTSVSAEGCALEILRSQPEYSKCELSPSVAAEAVAQWKMLNLEGPTLDRYAYEWFLKTKQNEIELMPRQDPLESHRVNYDGDVYCVDSADAHEIDDAISIQMKNSDVAILGVHIADPSSLFEPEGLIEAVCRQPSTVYLPKEAKFMLPQTVAEASSLQEGKKLNALSIFAELNMRSGERTAIRVAPTRLTNIKQVTYEKGDKLVDFDPTFKLFSRASEILRAQRVKNGAFFMNSSAAQIKITGGNDVSIVSSNPSSDAVKIVTEFMIQANQLAARFCRVNRIPGIYRGQTLNFWTRKQQKEFYLQLRESQDVGFVWRDAIMKARLFVKPMQHRALGIEEYMHFTSPLRRGQDILAHIQIGAHIAGLPYPLNQDQLDALLPWLMASQMLIKDCQNSTTRYWILKYLANQQPEYVRGTVSRITEDKVFAFLDDYGIVAEVKTGKVNHLKPDVHLKFKIIELSAVGDRLMVIPVA